MPRQRSPRLTALSLALAGALFAAACASTDPGEADPTDDVEVGPAQQGGRLVYGLEAETTSGWCLPEAQLAISGIQVARSIYDPLTIPDGDGGFRPFLAESVEPNADFTEWTITLREGITFHDGTELDAEVVKNNLDAYRGAYEGRNPLLFIFTFSDVEEVTVDDEMTLTVTTRRPWVAFPAFLYGEGRVGMMAQAQLDDESDCAGNLIGTGPFELVSWQVHDRLTLQRNEDYWRTDDEGNQLPYLDELEYRPIPEGIQRLNALNGGEIDAFHTAASTIIAQLRDEHAAGQINLVESDDFAEVGVYAMLNAGREPFDNPIAREAAAYALDYEQMNEVLAEGIPQIANGPMTPGAMGYVEDTGYPEYDPERARELVQQYEDETGQRLEFDLATTPSPELIRTVEMMKELFEDVGMSVTTGQYEQSAFIQRAIDGDYQAHTWRQYPDFDPDSFYVWWYGQGNPVNFMRFDDPEINRLLDEGRVTTDRDERQAIYEDLNRRMSEQLYMLWGSWTIWAIPSDTDVHGIVGARPLGTDGSEDYTGLAVGHDPALMWREQ